MQYLLMLLIIGILAFISIAKTNMDNNQIYTDKDSNSNIESKPNSNIKIINNGTANINIYQGPITIIQDKKEERN